MTSFSWHGTFHFQSILHDFNVGAFARFHDPLVVLSIHDRADFHSLSHLSIRQRLDEEGHEDALALIDLDTVATHAIWRITTKKESSYFTDFWDDDSHTTPILFPGETFTFWKLHLLTQDLHLSFYRWDIPGIEDPKRYDPHDPQIPPYTFGLNFSKKEDLGEHGPKLWIIAGPGEYELSDAPESQRKPDYNALWCL